MNIAHFLADEFKQVGRVTFYFLSCFGLILVLKKLFLAQYDIELYALSTAVVGYNVFSEINRHMGQGALASVFFSLEASRSNSVDSQI